MFGWTGLLLWADRRPAEHVGERPDYTDEDTDK
jgi:hypothetical protein